jgi:amidase
VGASTTPDDLSLLDATASAELVRSGQATPAELVDAAIARLERLDPQLHVLARERFEAARREARGDLPGGPFRGVPLVLKDLGAHVAGEVTAYGTSFLREVRRPETSHVAQLLQAAGFVVLGRSSTPELGTTISTEPASGVPARNPWDLSRSPGGSSGGSAAAVAAGLVPVAHASDGGGSIRIPAGACALVGLKPSRGRVSAGPATGETPWAGALTDGVVTRTVRDSAALLDCLSVAFPGDPYAAAPPARPFADQVGLRPGRLRVGVLDAPPRASFLPASPECAAAVARCAELLSDLGHAVEQGWPQALGEGRFGGRFAATIAADVALQLEQAEQALGRPVADDELEPRNVDYRRRAAALSAADYLRARAELGAWSRRVARWWALPGQGGDGHDLLVTPVTNGVPPPVGWYTAGPQSEGERIAAMLAYTSFFNVTGQPAVSLPLHWSEDGVPVGVQLVGAYGREDLLLQVASQLERAAPWVDRRPPVHAASGCPAAPAVSARCGA